MRMAWALDQELTGMNFLLFACLRHARFWQLCGLPWSSCFSLSHCFPTYLSISSEAKGDHAAQVEGVSEDVSNLRSEHVDTLAG